MMQQIKAHRPALHIKGFTAVELDYMFRKAKVSVEEGMKKLHAAGLDSLPGGGAESLTSGCPQRHFVPIRSMPMAG